MLVWCGELSLGYSPCYINPSSFNYSDQQLFEIKRDSLYLRWSIRETNLSAILPQKLFIPNPVFCSLGRLRTPNPSFSLTSTQSIPHRFYILPPVLI